MALVNTHPDYMNFNGKKSNIEEYPAEYYEEFLTYIKSKFDGRYWHVLPKDIAQFWSNSLRYKTSEDNKVLPKITLREAI